jgi:hypothetical protein
LPLSLPALRPATYVTGGSGPDSLTGGAGDDILVFGTTTYDANAAAPTAILNEWKRTDPDYQGRIDHIRGTTSGGRRERDR